MFDQILQEGETIVLHESGAHCGDGATAAVKVGQILLTNKRLLVLKKKGGNLGLIIGMIASMTIVMLIIFNANLGYIEAGLLGALFGAAGAVAGMLVENAIRKGKPSKTQHTPADIEFSFALDQITAIEDGKRGIHNMLVIKTNSGDTRKIGFGKNNDQWRAALKHPNTRNPESPNT